MRQSSVRQVFENNAHTKQPYSRIADLLVDSFGSSDAYQGDPGDGRCDVLTAYYNARPATIYGGSNEVQRNIVATQALQSPK